MLAAIVSIELYKQSENQSYYNWSKQIINILENYFWDVNNSGYHHILLDNFSLEYPANITQKSFESQIWAVMMYDYMFQALNYSNTSYYYRAEEIMAFCNNYFINNIRYNNSLYYSGY